MCTLKVNSRLIEINSNRENIRLIYLDNTELNNDIQLNLLELNCATLFYTNSQLCIDLIKNNLNENIFLIISNFDLIQSIHDLPSIIAIFIYNIDNQEYDINELKIQYPKTINIFTNLNGLVKSLHENIQFIEQQVFVYSLYDGKEKLSPSFVWYKMLLNILKHLKSHDESFSHEFLSVCFDYYENNPYELNRIGLFRDNYSREESIEWYLNDSFLCRFLNRALYLKDIESLYLFRFFILDLNSTIETKYKNFKEQNRFLTVYRTQLMTSKDIEKFQKNIDGYILTNSFLLTSREKQNLFLSKFSSIYNNVIFEIYIDFSFENVTLIDISSRQILFNINSLFKIDSVEFDFINNLWIIKISTSNEEIRFEQHNPMIYFGQLLSNDLGEIKQAKNYFQILLKLLSNDLSKIYTELGNINDEIGEYNLALNNYQNALDIHSKDDFIFIASLLNRIGKVYQHMKYFDKAINYCQQALDIYENKCFQKADIIENLGLIYKDKNEFDIALNYLTQSYNIRYDSLGNNHPLIADSLYNIGRIYHDKNDLKEAFNHYQQALSIHEISSTNDDLSKTNIFRHIGLIYRDKHEWPNALNYFHQTLEIRQRLLPNPIHPDIAICYGDIGTIYEKMHDLNLAFDYYHKQYEIEEQYYSINHPNLLIHFEIIINLLKKQEQFEKAIEYCHDKLNDLKYILKNSYENHPHRARLLILIATIYEDKNPRQADEYYQQVLPIIEHNKTEDIFCKCLSTMTNFYWKCRMFDRALICQMKLLHLRRSLLSSNHYDIAYTLRGIARLYRAMNKPTEALDYFNQSLTILQTTYGSQHIDVQNIQKEIYDLKDILKSISSTPHEDYNNRRLSNAHKEFLSTSTENSKSRSSLSPSPSTFTLKSSACIIL